MEVFTVFFVHFNIKDVLFTDKITGSAKLTEKNIIMAVSTKTGVSSTYLKKYLNTLKVWSLKPKIAHRACPGLHGAIF